MPVITVYDNVVTGPEEEKIPAHLHFGQFMLDQFKNGGEKVAQVSFSINKTCYISNLL